MSFQATPLRCRSWMHQNVCQMKFLVNKVINIWLFEVEMFLTVHSKNIAMKAELPILPNSSKVYQTFVLCFEAQVFLFLLR